MRVVGITAALTLAVAIKVSPLEKVVEMLQGMAEKGKQAKQTEKVQFAQYTQFCEGTTQDKGHQIEVGKQTITDSENTITIQSTRAGDLTITIGENDAQVAFNAGDLKASRAVREEEALHNAKQLQDYSESIDAIERAVNVLQQQNYDRSQASDALLQVSRLDMVPLAARKTIQSFIAMGATDAAMQAPEVDAYEFQSGSVIDTLDKLKEDFIDERTKLEKEEANSKHAANMLRQDLTNENADLEKQTRNLKTQRAEAQRQTAEAEGTLGDAKVTLAADEKYKTELDATCALKTKDFDARTLLRQEELDSIAKAIEIITSPEVSGNAEKHGVSLAEINRKRITQTSFIQVRSFRSVAQPTVDNERVASFLRQRAEKLNSRLLSALSMRLGSEARADPFAKVTKMIEDMILRLETQATEEQDQHTWCEKNLKENAADRKTFKGDVKKYTTLSEKLAAQIAKLGEEIKTLNADSAQLTIDIQEATTLRTAEEKENKETIGDAKNAQAALGNALAVLKQFYEKAGKATSFLQQNPTAPEVFDSPYQGMGGESGGVLGLLEVIQSDFARLEAETTAAESQATEEHRKFVEDTGLDIAVKDTDSKHKTSNKQRKTTAHGNAVTDLESSNTQLDSANNTYEKLKPTCVDSGFSYKDRVQRRKEEIQSLKEALEILSSEEFSA